nr:hypothetical protein [Tanacetum cinerariifolium]
MTESIDMSQIIKQSVQFNLYYDVVFVEKLFEYAHGDFKVIDDVDFNGLLYVQMYDIIRNVVLVSPTCLFFKLVDQPLVCLKPLKTDEDVGGRFIHEENDPEDDIVDPKFKAKKTICYPSIARERQGRPREDQISYRRIGSPIKREDNQVTEGGSMGNLTAEHKMDMEALAEDDELNRPEDSLEVAYYFDTISEFQDNELNVHQVSMDLPVNEAPENYTTEESQVQDPDPKPTIPTQESQIQTRSKIRKRVAETTSLRIYVKNRGKSERIAKMQANKFKFNANRTRLIADKAFDVYEDEK